MSFSDEKVQKVWEKGLIPISEHKDSWRWDECKAWIKRDKYGDINSIYGWEIDHIVPKSQGGSDSISNLRPLQWENNRTRADGKSPYCAVTSDGSKNIKK